MKAHLQKAAACIALLSLVLVATTQASPLFSIGEGAGATSWQDEINAGRVVAVTAAQGMTTAEEDFYDQEAFDHGLDGFQMRTAYLSADVNVTDGNAETHQALVMAWETLGSDDAGNNFGDVAAWEYVYDADPNLTGLKLSFSLLAASVWDVSVELIDIAGRTKGWFLIGPSPNWQNALIDLSSNAANQGGFMLQPLDPLFDITQVVSIRFDESGIWSMPFGVMPSGALNLPPIGPNNPGWNAWNHVAVIPEPSALVLAAVGAIGGVLLSAVRRKRRK